MSDNFDPAKKYNDDEDFNVRGSVLNGIGTAILNLRQQVKDMKNNAIMEELEELRLRDKNPPLKDAWDQYQTVLQLTKKR